jgi:hypothetical protein
MTEKELQQVKIAVEGAFARGYDLGFRHAESQTKTKMFHDQDRVKYTHEVGQELKLENFGG